MNIVEIYDPPMCCSSGLCGPAIDHVLLAVNDMILALHKQGVEVKRFNIAQQIKEVMANPAVAQALHSKGKKALPMTFVNGTILKSGSYPSYEELCTALAITPLSDAKPVTLIAAPETSSSNNPKE